MNADLHAAYWATHFGDWLRRTMNAKGVSRMEVIRRSGTNSAGRPVIDSSVMGRWLNGDVQPSVGKLLVLADALDVPSDEALAAAGYRYPLDVTPDPQRGLAVLVDDEHEQSFLAAVLAAYRNTQPTQGKELS